MEGLAELSAAAELERENALLREELLRLKLQVADLLAFKRETLLAHKKKTTSIRSDLEEDESIPRTTQSSVVTLNVGGKVFSTLKSTLTQYPGTFFEALFSGRHENLSRDNYGNFFIDRDPTYFQDILNLLRNPSGPQLTLPADETACTALFGELDYYGLLPIMLPRTAMEKLREWVIDFQNTCGPSQYHKRAAELYEEFVAGNEVERLYKEALKYDLGDDDMEHDYVKAVELYHQAAEKGHVDAQYNLAVCYQDGDGVEQDHEKAFRFFMRAAQQNHKQAQYYVALSYREGTGVEPNTYEAIHWFRKAAAQGHTVAQAFLADETWQVKNKEVCGW